MELKAYLNPADKISAKNSFGNAEGFLAKSIKQNDIKNCQIALIGVTETRNAYDKKPQTSLDLVRAHLYGLASLNKTAIADLGNIKPGVTVQDTYASVEFVVKWLTEKNIIPIFFGGSQDITVPIFNALQKPNSECVIIDNRLDLTSDVDLHSKNYINNLLMKNDAAVSVVGTQSYFVSKEQQQKAVELDVLSMRLGLIRNNFNDVEPILRDANLISFDVSAIKQSECPASFYPSPNGFYNEEACQLANWSGLSDKAEVYFISEYDSGTDKNEQSAQVVAQLIWHVLYGFSQRKGDYPKKELAAYKKIYVKIEKPDTEIVFYQNQSNNRYWVEIPKNNQGEVKIISCSEKDYRFTCNGEIPDRIWRNFSKFFS